MKNSFKKIILVVTSAASSIGSYMFSIPGATAATLGSLTAVTVFAVEKKKTNKTDDKKQEQQNKKETKKSKLPTNKTAQKKELRKKITTKKSELKKHRSELKKLKRTGSGATPESQNHRTIIEDLENDIKNIKRDLRNL